ncbi:hypothetical protein LP420_32470 [Massilia sp. B-10]|nr:hypothetical protein LP420_32470 [Massilia sp. B-10]
MAAAQLRHQARFRGFLAQLAFHPDGQPQRFGGQGFGLLQRGQAVDKKSGALVVAPFEVDAGQRGLDG